MKSKNGIPVGFYLLLWLDVVEATDKRWKNGRLLKVKADQVGVTVEGVNPSRHTILNKGVFRAWIPEPEAVKKLPYQARLLKWGERIQPTDYYFWEGEWHVHGQFHEPQYCGLSHGTSCRVMKGKPKNIQGAALQASKFLGIPLGYYLLGDRDVAHRTDMRWEDGKLKKYPWNNWVILGGCKTRKEVIERGIFRKITIDPAILANIPEGYRVLETGEPLRILDRCFWAKHWAYLHHLQGHTPFAGFTGLVYIRKV